MDCKIVGLFFLVAVITGQLVEEGSGQDCDAILCTQEYDPQCGSNGVTYSNPCTVQVAQCDDVSIQIASKGMCKADCEKRKCNKMRKPQCGNNGRTYSNPCTFRVAQCSDVTLQIAHEGDCEFDEGPCAWIACTQEFEPQCGSDGRTYGNKCLLEAAQCERSSLRLAYKGSCESNTLRIAEEPHHSSVKAGFCPAINLGQFGSCLKECTVDTDCTEGHHKCCESGCSTLCLPARVSKPGVCPVAPVVNEKCAGAEPESTCDSDVDCRDADKCCFDGCYSVCVDPQPREGFCPLAPTSEPEPSPFVSSEPEPEPLIGICVNNCTIDHECSFPKKCCSNGCGYTCVEPEVPKAGLCAPISPVEGFGACVSLCHRDNECEAEQKCCSNGCGHTCQEPEWGTCEKDFRKYHNNETKLDVNNCDECTCINGTLECTERHCYCEYKGRTYESGRSFSAKDGCNKCHCFGLKVICTDFICHDDKGESKKILGIVLGCVFGALSIILIVAVTLAVCSALKKKKNTNKTPKNVPHSASEAKPLPTKV